jgi:hypothetical protein
MATMAKQSFTEGDDLYLNCDMTEEEARKKMNIPDSTKVLEVNVEPITDTLNKGDPFGTVLIHFNMKDFYIFRQKYLEIMGNVCKQAKVERDIIAWFVNDPEGKPTDMLRTPKQGFLDFLEKMKILCEPEYLEAKRMGQSREYVRQELKKDKPKPKPKAKKRKNKRK